MSFFNKIRQGGGLDSTVKELSARQQVFEAEHSVEDTDEIIQSRVDYDDMAITTPASEQKQALDGDKTDTDSTNLSSGTADGQYRSNSLFCLAGGDCTSYLVHDSVAKTGDTLNGNGGFDGLPAVVGACSLGGY
jgi:hypothetical protein